MEYIYNYDFINFPPPLPTNPKHENNKTWKQQNTTDDVAGVLSSKVGLK